MAKRTAPDPAEARTVRFVVRGRVQGVGFRWFVERVASELGLSGYVRNQPDGSVEVVATGTNETLRRLRAELAAGPPAARVEAVSEEPAEADVRQRGFRIE